MNYRAKTLILMPILIGILTAVLLVVSGNSLTHAEPARHDSFSIYQQLASKVVVTVAVTTTQGGGGGSVGSDNKNNCDPSSALCADCQAGGKGCVNCSGNNCGDPAADPRANCNIHNCDFVKKYVNPAINLFSIIFGLIAVISIILGGINYSTSEGDPQKAGRAKQRISNTVFAIVAYFFLYAFLQFLIPGGIF